MKYAKALLIVSILFVSCSNDDDKKNCNCRGEWMNPGATTTYFGPTETDCETGEPLTTPPGNPDAIFLGCDN